MDICIGCRKDKKVFCQKRKLCQSCYGLWYRSEKNTALVNDKINHTKEVDFIKNYFTHLNWIYQPATFRLNGTRYTPDFYDGERKVFIEVSGTRQAFYQSRARYKMFVETYPQINFEIRQFDGRLIDINTGHYNSKKKT